MASSALPRPRRWPGMEQKGDEGVALNRRVGGEGGGKEEKSLYGWVSHDDLVGWTKSKHHVSEIILQNRFRESNYTTFKSFFWGVVNISGIADKGMNQIWAIVKGLKVNLFHTPCWAYKSFWGGPVFRIEDSSDWAHYTRRGKGQLSRASALQSSTIQPPSPPRAMASAALSPSSPSPRSGHRWLLHSTRPNFGLLGRAAWIRLIGQLCILTSYNPQSEEGGSTSSSSDGPMGDDWNNDAARASKPLLVPTLVVPFISHNTVNSIPPLLDPGEVSLHPVPRVHFWRNSLFLFLRENVNHLSSVASNNLCGFIVTWTTKRVVLWSLLLYSLNKEAHLKLISSVTLNFDVQWKKRRQCVRLFSSLFHFSEELLEPMGWILGVSLHPIIVIHKV